ncbi:hypothetical protein HaLaN_10716, partial [Haematococcus lacustris]
MELRRPGAEPGYDGGEVVVVMTTMLLAIPCDGLATRACLQRCGGAADGQQPQGLHAARIGADEGALSLQAVRGSEGAQSWT